MHLLLAVVILLMPDLGGPFVDASAEASRADGGLRVELEVQLNTEVSTVVAHVASPGQEQQTVALSDRGNGVHGGFMSIDAEDVVVVFEVLDVDRDLLSQPVTLTELGVDPSVFESDRSFAVDEDGTRIVTPTARRWLWSAAGLGLASIALIAWWAMGARSDGAAEREDEPADVESRIED